MWHLKYKGGLVKTISQVFVIKFLQNLTPLSHPDAISYLQYWSKLCNENMLTYMWPDWEKPGLMHSEMFQEITILNMQSILPPLWSIPFVQVLHWRCNCYWVLVNKDITKGWLDLLRLFSNSENITSSRYEGGWWVGGGRDGRGKQWSEILTRVT